jgi:hypothetical protein
MECIMKKYMGLILLAGLAAGVALAVKAAPDGRQAGRDGGTVGDAQIGQLDKRLSDRIVEQQELMTLVEKLLHLNFQQREMDRSTAANVLSGQAKPPAPPPPAPQVAKKADTAAAPVAPPWWTDYKPQMVYGSSTERYAVVNGKMVRRGQTLGKDVMVDGIEEDSVVLRLGTETHSFSLKK